MIATAAKNISRTSRVDSDRDKSQILGADFNIERANPTNSPFAQTSQGKDRDRNINHQPHVLDLEMYSLSLYVPEARPRSLFGKFVSSLNKLGEKFTAQVDRLCDAIGNVAQNQRDNLVNKIWRKNEHEDSYASMQQLSRSKLGERIYARAALNNFDAKVGHLVSVMKENGDKLTGINRGIVTRHFRNNQSSTDYLLLGGNAGQVRLIPLSEIQLVKNDQSKEFACKIQTDILSSMLKRAVSVDEVALTGLLNKYGPISLGECQKHNLSHYRRILTSIPFTSFFLRQINAQLGSNVNLKLADGTKLIGPFQGIYRQAEGKDSLIKVDNGYVRLFDIVEFGDTAEIDRLLSEAKRELDKRLKERTKGSISEFDLNLLAREGIWKASYVREDSGNFYVQNLKAIPIPNDSAITVKDKANLALQIGKGIILNLKDGTQYSGVLSYSLSRGNLTYLGVEMSNGDIKPISYGQIDSLEFIEQPCRRQIVLDELTDTGFEIVASAPSYESSTVTITWQEDGIGNLIEQVVDTSQVNIVSAPLSNRPERLVVLKGRRGEVSKFVSETSDESGKKVWIEDLNGKIKAISPSQVLCFKELDPNKIIISDVDSKNLRAIIKQNVNLSVEYDDGSIATVKGQYLGRCSKGRQGKLLHETWLRVLEPGNSKATLVPWSCVKGGNIESV